MNLRVWWHDWDIALFKIKYSDELKSGIVVGVMVTDWLLVRGDDGKFHHVDPGDEKMLVKSEWVRL